ncbi:MAG: hypothetical protein Fur007_01460 [Rhodoferax sp.]
MVDFTALTTLGRAKPSPAPAQPARRLGRFELRRLLGRGAQAQVWLGFDARLEREVAIKIIDAQAGQDEASRAGWLQEARSVSRLKHPNIVPVFEADVHDQQVYLVFEYVPGQTLAQRLAQKGALPAPQALHRMQEILGALVAAHAIGIVHRDLKPSNLLFDDSDRLRVMDFGIAARVDNSASMASPTEAAGTPAYMAPEAIRGEPVSPSMDIFTAGMVMAEMLWGKPIRSGRDVQAAMQRAASTPQDFPAELMVQLDDDLRSMLLRACAFAPAQRYPSAQHFLDAVEAWLQKHQPQANTDAPEGSASNATLDFLLRRMRNKSDFPALSESVVRIQTMATSEKESVSSITNEILKDVALTNKLLRLVNSAHYARGNSIGTVSRAVTLVGFNGIRNMALSLVLLEHMQDKTNAHLLKEEFLRALMAGSVAAELGATTAESEQAFIGALFQNLGRMLCQFYFPEESAAIRNLVHAPKSPMSEDAAAVKVLGLNFEALGMGVAKAWGLPESIQHCIVCPSGEPPSVPSKDPMVRLRWSARAANEMASAMLHADPAVVDSRLSQMGKKYARVLNLTPEAIDKSTEVARNKLVEMARAMDITVRPDSNAAHLLREAAQVAKQVEYTQAHHDALDSADLQATQVVALERAPSSVQQNDHASQILAAGIQDITNAMVEEFKLPEILRMILESMFRALNFQRIVFCMRDPKTETLTGRFGLGADVDTIARQFSVPLNPGAGFDLFGTICNKGADTLISDSRDPKIAQRLPSWYVKSYHAPCFLILPLLLKGRPFGLIYADKAEPGALQVDEKELSMLRTLRNQAVMAFRQAG